MKDLSHVSIETNRLLLSTISEDQIIEIFNLYRLPLTKYMYYTTTGTFEELSERHFQWQRELKEGTKLSMAVTLKSTKEFLGSFALENLHSKTPVLGGWIKSDYHGFKYGQEAAQALKDWADQHLIYDYIVWPCAVENIASCKLAEALGGSIHQEYSKKMASGMIWEFREYQIASSSNG